MTNKTEMVSDAELDELEVAEVLLAQQGFSNLAAAISAAYTFIKETRAAPAEDVRAVVEEPVAFYRIETPRVTVSGEVTEWFSAIYWYSPEEIADLKTPYRVIEKLYRHPQRPVVLPDRLREVWLFLDGQAELEGCVFGEKPEGRHNFWWRKEFRAVLEELYPQQ